MTSIAVIRSAPELDGYANEWNALLEKSQPNEVFLTWEWISSWVRETATGDKLCVIAVRSDGELIALAPLWMEKVHYRGVVELRVLRPLGFGISDYFDWIVRADRMVEGTTAIWEHLFGPLRREWDVFDYSEVPESSPVLAELSKLAVKDHRSAAAELAKRTVCSYIVLPGSWEEFLRHCHRDRRYFCTYSRRRLGQEGDLRVQFCERTDELRDQMSDLIALNKASWRERGGSASFSSASLERFHHRVAQEFLKIGRLLLCRLSLNGQHIGSFYGFQYNHKAYYYISAVKRHPVSRINVLNALLGFCVEEAARRNCREFDFLRGDEEYKARWTDLRRQNVSIHFYNRGMKATLILSYRKYRNRANHRRTA
jgi:CelD/BcsL family acetyltransferase involved in cellulose biosynthesis